jgi:5S rRNA maturation endonuclease (ribonuclease M5)
LGAEDSPPSLGAGVVSPYERVIAALRAHGSSPGGGGNWTCPAHDDRRASLSVRNGDGRVLLRCHAGCVLQAVLGSLGLEKRDLFDEPKRRNGRPEPEAVYKYVDEEGRPLFEVVRFPGKVFWQRRPDGQWGVKGVRRVLYHLPQVVEAVKAGRTVYVVEGEKDVEALERAGAAATCNPGGAGKWRREYGAALRSAHVVVVADRDDAGRMHAAQVAEALHGVAASVQVVEPAKGKDAADHLAAGRGLGDLVPVRESAADLEDPGTRVELTPARRIRSQRIRWAWQGRMPLRGVVVVAGEKGLGKSILTNAKLVADVTRGRLEGELAEKLADVLVVTAEDDWETVVKPRLVAHDADLDRVHRVEVRDESGEGLLTLPDHTQLLEAEIRQLVGQGHKVGMLVVDPIGAFLSGSTDTHRDGSVRRALAPLAAMAERLDLVVVVVAHLTKDQSSRYINRVSGAGAFVNAARSVLVMVRDPDDPKGEQGNQRVLVHVASNWGVLVPSLALRVESRLVDLDDGSAANTGYLVVTGESAIGVDDLQRHEDTSGTDVEEAIAEALAGGQRPSREVKSEIKAELGCSLRTVERAAVRMRDRGELTIESGSFPRVTKWGLGQSRHEPLLSSDTAKVPVATSPNIRRVATDSSDVVTGFPVSSPDSRDTLARARTRRASDGDSNEAVTKSPATEVVEDADVDRWTAAAGGSS